MRLVRFHLEPGQRGGSEFSSPCASPCSLLVVTASVHRRQRSVDINDNVVDVQLLSQSAQKRAKDKVKWRYPQKVKKLTIMCSDVIAKNVRSSLAVRFYRF